MSNETKFTNGPWIVCHTGPHWNNPDLANIDIQIQSGENIADTVYIKADAHLIASAPEMYAELEHAAEMLDTLYHDLECMTAHVFDDDDLIRFKNLLAKARGNTNA